MERTTERKLQCSVVIATLFVVVLTARPVAAQIPDLVDLGGQYLPAVRLAEPAPARAQVASYDAVFHVPAPLGDDTFLIAGGSYHADSVSFADAPPELIDLRAFHAVDASLLFVQLLPHGWSLSLRTAAGLAGDFEAVDEGLLRLSAMAMATHAFSEGFVLGGGVVASYAFGSFLPLPAAYLEWRPWASFRVEAFLPAFVQLRQELWGRVELGYRAEVQGNAYAVRDARIAERWPCVQAGDGTPADPSGCFDHLAYSVITVGPTLSLRLFSSVWLRFAAGHTVFRRFEMMSPSDEVIAGSAQDLPSTYFLGTGLTWRVPL